MGLSPTSVAAGIISNESIAELTQKVDDTIMTTIMTTITNKTNAKTSSPPPLLRQLNFPSSGMLEHSTAVEVFERAIEVVQANFSNIENTTPGELIPIMSPCEGDVLKILSGCHLPSLDHNVICSNYHQKYRSINGTCNNINKPFLGSSGSPLRRLLPPAYENGLGLPRGWSGALPSARLISSRLLSAGEVDKSTTHTHMLMQFGQLLDHDLVLTPTPNGVVSPSGESCEDTCSNSQACFPIPVSPSDPRITRRCIPFTRSTAVCGSGASSLLIGSQAVHREQFNNITSYIDASMIYGSDEERALRLRDPSGRGRLLMGASAQSGGKPLLPFKEQCTIDQYGIPVADCTDFSFLAGDERANEQVNCVIVVSLNLALHG